MAVPGFEVEDLDVAATPNTLVVHAEKKHEHKKGNGEVYFCEFGEKELFRQFNFPGPIDVERENAMSKMAY